MTRRPRILLFGDSYGTVRQHGNVVEVAHSDIWPVKVEQAFCQVSDVVTDFVPYRMLTASCGEIAAHGRCDVIVLMAGIVDCYPRPLPMGVDRSLALPARVLRRAIRPVRRHWIRHVHRRPYATFPAIEAALNEIEARCDHLILVTYPAVTKRHCAAIPGAQDSIDALTALFRKQAAAGEGRVAVADAAKVAMETGRDDLVSARDSHLSRAGNALVADLVGEALARYLARPADDEGRRR